MRVVMETDVRRWLLHTWAASYRPEQQFGKYGQDVTSEPTTPECAVAEGVTAGTAHPSLTRYRSRSF